MKEFLLVTLPFLILVPLGVGSWAWLQRRRNPPTTEALEAAAVLGDPRWLPSGWGAITFVFAYEAAEGLEKFVPLSGALKIVVLILPASVFVWFMYAFFRELRSGDELTKRVQADAVSLAFPMFLLWSMGMWLMDEIDPAPHHGTFRAALAFLPLYYWIGLFLAKGKYLPTTRSRHENP